MEKTDTLGKKVLSRSEIALMAVITPLVFCVIFGGSFFLIVYILGGIGGRSGGWLCSPLGLLVILVFGIAWIYITRLLCKEYKKSKIIFTAIGLAISIAALIIWILDNLPPIKFG
jgi:hypothetical protein